MGYQKQLLPEELCHSEAILIWLLIEEPSYRKLIFSKVKQEYFRDEKMGVLFDCCKELDIEDKLNYDNLVSSAAKQGIKLSLITDIVLKYFVDFSLLRTAQTVRQIINYIFDEYSVVVLNNMLKNKKSIIEIKSFLNEYKNISTIDALTEDNFLSFADKVGSEKPEFLPYPIGFLNKILGGAKKRELAIIAARPSVGKSSFMEQMFWDNSKAGKKCLFISLEMTKQVIVKRHCTRLSGFNYFKETYSKEQWTEVVAKAKADYGNSTIVSGSFTIGDIEALIREYQPEIVFIDYLQIVRVDSYKKLSDYERVTEVTMELSRIRNTYDVALVVAAQYARTGKYSQPDISEVKGSGQIEQDADVFLSLWKTNPPQKIGEDSEKVYIDCLKNRNGAVFFNSDNSIQQYALSFNKKNFEFLEVDTSHLVDGSMTTNDKLEKKY